MGPPDHPRHSGRSGDWGSGLSLTPLTSRCLCAGLTVCEKPEPRTRVPAACVCPPCSLGSPASWPVCPPRLGLTLLTLQRAVYLCMAVPRHAGVWVLGARAHAEVRGSPWVKGRGMSSRGPGQLSGRQGSDRGTRPGEGLLCCSQENLAGVGGQAGAQGAGLRKASRAGVRRGSVAG